MAHATSFRASGRNKGFLRVIALLGLLCWSGVSWGQVLFDTFSDGNFTTNPVWGGNTSAWTIVTNSDVAAGANNSNSLRLNSTAVAATDYLSSQINTWGDTQEWGFFIGRRGQAFTSSNQQYIWLYANEATLNNSTVDGYRIAIGDDNSSGDKIRLEYIVNGSISSTVITSTGAITNGLTDIGFLLRITRTTNGVWTLYTSLLPTTNGNGAIATDIPNSTNVTINQGSSTNNTLQLTANGYVGVAALHSTGANAIVAAEFDQIYFTPTFNSNTAPILSTPTSTSITITTATLGASITSNGGVDITESGIVYGTSASPTGNATPTDPLISSNSAFSVGVSSLSPQTLYYYRGYAINTVGTGYSADGTFRTLSNPPTAQASNLAGSATSQSIVNLTWDAATFPTSGASTTGYVLLRATSPNTPSLSNANGAAPAGGTNTTIVSPPIAGSATSASSISLTANTTYNYLLVPYCWDGNNAATYNYLTASATTTSVTTLPNAPSITTTNAISGISTTGATSGGTTLNANGGTISAKGVVWNITTTPSLPGLGNTSDGTGASNYTSAITGLDPQTLYYVRAYAINEGGTGYGTNVQFRTFSNPPTTAATNLTANATSSNSVDLSWVAATFPETGATTKRYILLRSVYPNAPVLGSENGTAPSGGTNTTLASSSIASSDVTYTANSGLSANVKYTFALVPNTYDGANATTNNYYTNSMPTVSITTLAVVPGAPTVAGATYNSLNISMTLGSNPNTTEFAIYETTTGKYVQADGSLDAFPVWQTNVTWGTKTVNGLSPATAYTFQVKAKNLDLIETSFGTSADGITLATEPTSQPTNLSFSTLATSSFNVSFTAASGTPDFYLVLRRSGSAPTGTPADGTAYTLNQTNIGSGTNTVAYVGSATSFSETGLTAGTTYYYAFYSFNGTGSAINYYTTSPLTGNQITVPAAPTANSATLITLTSLSANWSATTGAASYRLDVATDNGFTNILSGYNDLNVGTVTTYSVTGLTTGTTYYYRVRAVNAGGTSINSSTITISTASNYYSQGNSAPESLNSWNSKPDGSGIAPSNFTSSSNYIIQNGHAMTTATTWAFGGAGSVLQIQNEGVLQSDYAITIASGATFQIENGGKYIHNNTTAPSTTIFNGIENFKSQSNVRIDKWSSNITVLTTNVTLPFGNLEINWTTNTNNWQQGWTETVNLCSGNLLITSVGSGSIRFAAGTGPIVNISGNYKQTGGIVNLASSTGSSITILNVAGNFEVSDGTCISTSTGSKVVLNGNSPQAMNVNSTKFTVNNLTINNSSGVTLNQNITINGTLDLTSGKLNTGSNTLTIGASGTVSNARSSSYINGNVIKLIAAETTSKDFEIGDATTYAPVNIAFAGSITNSTGSIQASTTSGDHAQIASSGLVASKTVNRTWTLSNPAAITGMTSYSPTFNFVAGDIDTGATTSAFSTTKYFSSAWAAQSMGTKESTSTQATGVTSFGDFAIGEPSTATLTTTSAGMISSKSASSGGIISSNGGAVVTDRGVCWSITENPTINDNYISSGTGSGMFFSTLSDLSPTTTYYVRAYATNSSGTAYGNNVTFTTLASYLLTLIAGPNGSITPSTGYYDEGSRTVTATPASGYRFANWTEDGIVVSTNPVYTFTLASNRSLTANFASNTVSLTEGITAGSTLTNCTECDVTVANGATLNVDENKTFKSVTVFPGGKLTLANGRTLAPGTLILQSDATGTATFVDQNAAAAPPVVSGTVHQWLTSGRNWYIASPVTSAGTGALSTANSVVYWNEPAGDWSTQSDGNLDPMRGYISVSTNETKAISFTGALNSGKKEIALTRTQGAAKEGFNLVGNPYPSYLKWTPECATAGNVQPTIWYRTKPESSAYTFYTYNAEGKVGVPTDALGIIPPMQAFWVRANAGGGKLTFDNSMRMHSTSQNLLKAPAAPDTDKKVLRLQVSNGTNSDETVVYFKQGASESFDRYDSPKMSNANVAVPEIYTLAGTEELVINGIGSYTLNAPIALGFRPGKSGRYSINASEVWNFDTDVRVMLADRKESIEWDITNSTYEFDADETTTNERFDIIFRTAGITTGVNENDLQPIMVRVNEHNRIVISGNGRVRVFNAIGQQVDARQLTGQTITIDKLLVPGVYLVMVSGNGQDITRKVIIR